MLTRPPRYQLPILAPVEAQSLDVSQGRVPKSYFFPPQGSLWDSKQQAGQHSWGAAASFMGIRAPTVCIQTWWPGCPLGFLITVRLLITDHSLLGRECDVLGWPRSHRLLAGRV